MSDFTKLKIFLKALRIRMVEEFISSQYPSQEIRCPTHLSIGQELPAVLISEAISKDDYMVSTHRSHAHYLAKGGSLVGLLGELYGKEVGCSRGFGGSMHLTDMSAGFVCSTSIVGGTIPLGVGAAFYSKLKGLNRLSVVCLGDAGVEEGVFHECVNFAALHSLPVIFFIENNKYSCYTHIHDRQPHKALQSCGLSHCVDTLNLETNLGDLSYLNRAVELAHEHGPRIVVMDTYRWVEHCGPNNDDHLDYRKDSFNHYDQLKTLQHHLFEARVLNEDTLASARVKFEQEINMAMKVVKESPFSKERYLYA